MSASLSSFSAISWLSSFYILLYYCIYKIKMIGGNKKHESPNIYHEKQVKELCALHALNNLFQERQAFRKEQLDEICYNLSPDHIVNPHKSLLGLGNYDVNVLMSALQMKNYEMIWFDKRKDPECLEFANIYGFILNIPSDYTLGFIRLPLKRRHWIAVRRLDEGNYYNLDSKLNSPSKIGQEAELMTYLKHLLNSKEKELFVIVEKEVETSGLWQKGSGSRRCAM